MQRLAGVFLYDSASESHLYDALWTAFFLIEINCLR
jgi:hypothetical protein